MDYQVHINNILNLLHKIHYKLHKIHYKLHKIHYKLFVFALERLTQIIGREFIQHVFGMLYMRDVHKTMNLFLTYPHGLICNEFNRIIFW